MVESPNGRGAMSGPLENLSYFFKRIDEDNFLVTWENGKQQIMTSAELVSFYPLMKTY